MSIQSNINNTIGQASILASLNPNIQELGETAKDKRKFKNIEKQLDTMVKERAHNYDPEKDHNPAFIHERDAEQYNKLREAHDELAGKFASKGINIDYFYPEGFSEMADLRERLAKINADIQRAKEQRQKVEAMQKLKEAEAKAAQEFRSKQIRDLIMNPNLEVNNGTGNDTRR